jgi:predicted nuclease with TOPRIM domain
MWVTGLGIGVTLLLAFFGAQREMFRRFDEVNSRIDMRFDQLSRRIDELSRRFDELNERLSRLEGRFDEMARWSKDIVEALVRRPAA